MFIKGSTDYEKSKSSHGVTVTKRSVFVTTRYALTHRDALEDFIYVRLM